MHIMHSNTHIDVYKSRRTHNHTHRRMQAICSFTYINYARTQLFKSTHLYVNILSEVTLKIVNRKLHSNVFFYFNIGHNCNNSRAIFSLVIPTESLILCVFLSFFLSLTFYISPLYIY